MRCDSPIAEETKLMDLVNLLPPDLLMQALTHSSWVMQRTDSYERLEFLGDSVLGLAIADLLYERYPEAEEGKLARVKAFVVSRSSCVQVARKIGIDTLILEKSPTTLQKRKEAAENASILGNMLEGLIGASFLAHGFSRTALAVVDSFEEQIRFALKEHVDYKTTLQEVLATQGVQPSYRLVAEEGPPHARHFTSEVMFTGKSWGRGSGTTIKMSEQEAAKVALSALRAKQPASRSEPAHTPSEKRAGKGSVSGSS